MSFLKRNIQIKLKAWQFILGFLLIFVTPASQAVSVPVDKIVAVVNNEAITQSEVNRVLAAIEAELKATVNNAQEFNQKLQEIRKNIIQQMVEEKLILAEAKKNELKIDEEIIEQHLAKIKKSFSNDAEFEKSLEASELTLSELQNRFRDQELMKRAVERFVGAEIKIDPLEVKQYYEAHQEEFFQPEKAHLQGILIKIESSGDEPLALQKAKLVLEQIHEGVDFTQLAKQYSQGANAQEGGELGWIEKGQLIKEIDAAIFSLNPGECSGVIRTQEGYRIFKLLENQPQKPLAFEEAQNAVKEILYRQKFTEKFKQWLEKLKQNADIVLKEDIANE